MSRCCYADEYGEHFTEGSARRTARRFRRRGLRGSARMLADGIAATGIAGATVLEVGGGVGHLQAHLLRSGASRATNVELSPTAEAAAEELFAELGLRDRIERRIGDFVEEADGLPEADVVVLHRVLCCYPDWEAMTAAAVAHARRTVGLTIPVDRWWTRAAIGLGNRLLALRGQAFRAFVHPPERVLATIADAGFDVRLDRSGAVWRTIVLVRSRVRDAAGPLEDRGRQHPEGVDGGVREHRRQETATGEP